MFPILLTKKREAALDRLWRVLKRCAAVWALAVLAVVCTGLLEVLPQWALAVLFTPVPLATVLLIVDVCADCSPEPQPSLSESSQGVTDDE